MAFTLLLVISCSVEKKASKTFDRGQFQSTIDLYEQVLRKDPNNAEANFYIAESYRQSNRLQEAEPYYKTALDRGLKNDSIRLFYAFSLKSNGKYAEARQQLEQHLKTVDDKGLAKRSQEEFDNLNNLDEIRAKKNYFRVKNLDEINSPYAEYAPVYQDGELYFTSSRGIDKIYKATGTPFTDIYKVKTQGARVDTTTIVGLGDLINYYNINEGSVTFSPDGKTMVFARGNSGKKKGTADVNLYISSNRRDGWTEPRMLNINNPGYWDSSPAFSRDGRTLYFASNRPGGYGGTDIYSAKRDSRGRFHKVTNLGPEINTTGNEMFPYISDDGHMYFSSDGHPGFGGLDLFVAKRRNGRIEIENLGEPLNSNADDFGLFLFKADRGFFTSNREGGKGDDDIYTFVNEDPDLKIVNYYLAGLTKTHNDKNELVILPGVNVRLLDYKGEVLDESTTTDDGKFLFRVYEHEHYNLVGEKRGGKDQYLITRTQFTTVGRAVDRDTLKDLVTDVRFDTLLVLEKIEKNKIFVLENIYYDLDKADIREDAARELDKLVTILEDNPELKIELSSHTDDRADDDYNMKLSQRRARSAVDYIISQGITASRLMAKGYGESKLIIPNAKTEEEHQVNRRTEFKILEVGERKPETAGEFDEDRFFDDEEGDSGGR
ncbi:Outer membrane lipoprotein omp16 precursor [Fulvivirga imtechensis AK7]|uniref:Outer membrane lipoprotein omp16 n=2 Tax=Fulvivirga TaxID=396811 RepID=L8JXM5_9BACT|nr:Outer membrane lipoprotein omp16 precursor [Fulvivirga imtechensis AK7]